VKREKSIQIQIEIDIIVAKREQKNKERGKVHKDFAPRAETMDLPPLGDPYG